jgi:hypothetical protein
VSVGSSDAMDEVSETRSSTLTSVCVADGGSERRTVRNVSWRRTACQTLRRCCFSKGVASGVTGGGETG